MSNSRVQELFNILYLLNFPLLLIAMMFIEGVCLHCFFLLLSGFIANILVHKKNFLKSLLGSNELLCAAVN